MRGYSYILFCIIASALIVFKKCQASGVNSCGPSHFPCDNSECIQRDRWCDGEIDCADGSDEAYCKEKGWFGPVPNNGCSEKYFVCDNGRCMPAVAQCDGHYDCNDFSDEFRCPEASSKSTDSFTTSSVEGSRSSRDSALTSENDADGHDSLGAGASWDSSTRSRFVTSTTRTPLHTTKRATFQTSNDPAEDFYARKVQESTDSRRQELGGYPPQPRYYDHDQNGQSSHYNQPSSRSSDVTPGYNFRTDEYRPPSRHPTRSYATTPSTYGGRVDPTIRRHSRVPRPHPTLITKFIINPPPERHFDDASYKISNVPLPAFHFSTNFAGQVGSKYERTVRKAKEWLIKERDTSYSWGEDTPRALVAISLITNSFTSDVADNELMKKNLQTELALKLIGAIKDPRSLSVVKLAMYINALLATCQNPRNFWGLDLTSELYKKRNEIRNLLSSNDPTVVPYIYIALCNSNSVLDEGDIYLLTSLLVKQFPDEIAKDKHILAISALSCILKRNDLPFGQNQDRRNRDLRTKVNIAVDDLINKVMQADGSFGSVYSTAIAAQALMAAEINWNSRSTLDFITRSQLDSGSFGDMLSTYYAIPALSGRSLLHLRNTECDYKPIEESFPDSILNEPGPRKYVFCSVAIGYPERTSFSMLLNVPVATSAFDILRIAEHYDKRYKFHYKEFTNIEGAIEVNEISDIPNDPERGLYWHLYVLNPSDQEVDLGGRNTPNIKKLIPMENQELLFWYFESPYF